MKCSYCQETVDENLDEFDRCEDCTIDCLDCGEVVQEVDNHDRGLDCCAISCICCGVSILHSSSIYCKICRPYW